MQVRASRHSPGTAYGRGTQAMNKTLSFHEQTGILIPGAALVFALLFFFPEFRQLFFSDGVSIGGLGLFLLISYAAGHLAAALGNVLEAILWPLAGGRPSSWVVKENCALLAPEQISSLEALIKQRLRLEIPPLRGMNAKQWLPISRQIHADVMSNGKSGRIEGFNGNYGLNRGLAAALLALVLIGVAFSDTDWRVTISLLPIALIYMYRMYRFGVSYASELYAQFLLLPAQPPIPKRPSNVTRLPVP
jgi:hypothetical protein